MALPVLQQIASHGQRLALCDAQGACSYAELQGQWQRLAAAMLATQKLSSGARIAFLLSPGRNYTATLLAAWQVGAMAVPMCISHPAEEWAYVLDDAQPALLIAESPFFEQVAPLAAERKLSLYRVNDLMAQPLPETWPVLLLEQAALMIYTSGTTGKPKGVVLSHRNIEAQIRNLVEAWEWTASDMILNPLPLHHIHGLVNVLLCALWAGACCEFMPKFEAEKVWKRWQEADFTLFMAVPTVYHRLIQYYEESTSTAQAAMRAACQKMRLMVSGSAALPESLLAAWQAISGHVLLERYGMSEIGMVLSNPYRGRRLPGKVGKVLPRTQVKLVDEHMQEVALGESGQIVVKGETVFSTYWQKPQATAEAFREGWFLTGDIALQDAEGNFQILGRNSTDIIKTGGYKVSALEIEACLLQHEAIAECAVVALPDEAWGERIAAALVARNKHTLDTEALRHWLKQRLAAYKVPQQMLTVEALPRNAMNKILKNEVKQLFL
jgi:malonyl-CoA/methylmalonyl-CoA synthetase